jgi:membrane fusion protein (multidrug efflux system)
MIPHYRVFLLAILLGSALFSATSERTFVVETTLLSHQPFSLKRRYIGTINAENFSILRVKSTGTVSAIHVKAEQAVKKGQLLISLDNRSGKSSLEIAAKTHQSLKKELERLKELKVSHDVTKAQVDKAKRELLASSMALETTRKGVEETEIRAPFDGVVGVARVVIGESVKPETPIISIKQGAYTLTFLVPPSRIRELSIGQKVSVGEEQSSIAAIERTIDPLTRTGFAKANFSACKSCIIGESVFAWVTVAEKAKALLVDRNAVFYDKGKPFVVVVKTNEAKETRADQREVVLGQEQDGQVEIVSGISVGERIVRADPKRITLGALLKVLP